MTETFHVAVVGGTGNEGRGLALRLALAGVRVTIGSREEQRALDTAAALRSKPGVSRIDGSANGDAIAAADVVFLAVPFAHAEELIAIHHERFRHGALLIDVTVPVIFEGGRPRFVEPPAGSAAEQIRRVLPEHVRLACAFKTLPARLLEHVDIPLECDDLICGDSKESREAAMQVVGRISGLRPVDAGPLETSRILERMTLLAITLNKRYKTHGARFKVLGI
ncbi:NADPH-dependent F420 reductase [soil metagenome]